MSVEEDWFNLYRIYPPLELNSQQENRRKKKDKDPFKGIYSNALWVFMNMPGCKKDTKKCCIIEKLEKSNGYQAIILEDVSNDRVFIMNTTIRTLFGDESNSLTYTAYSTRNINNEENWRCDRRLTLRSSQIEEEVEVQPNSQEHELYKETISSANNLLMKYKDGNSVGLVCRTCPFQENSLPGTVA